MRIAEVAPLAESVPPKLYGGTERVVSWLTEELVGLGCDVTLFASANSLQAPLSSLPVHVPCGSIAQGQIHGPLTRLSLTRLRTGQKAST